MPAYDLNQLSADDSSSLEALLHWAARRAGPATFTFDNRTEMTITLWKDTPREMRSVRELIWVSPIRAAPAANVIRLEVANGLLWLLEQDHKRAPCPEDAGCRLCDTSFRGRPFCDHLSLTKIVLGNGTAVVCTDCRGVIG